MIDKSDEKRNNSFNEKVSFQANADPIDKEQKFYIDGDIDHNASSKKMMVDKNESDDDVPNVKNAYFGFGLEVEVENIGF